MVRPINRCLNSQLVDICQRMMKLDHLDNKIKAILPPHLREYCHVGSFNKGCLVITTTNAAWATELRYMLPELRDKLRKEGLYQLSSIKIAISDVEEPKALHLNPKPLISTAARANIRTASELCTYPPLKEALERLAATVIESKG